MSQVQHVLMGAILYRAAPLKEGFWEGGINGP